MLEPWKVIPNSWEKEYAKDLVPSAAWVMVVLPLASVLVALFPMPMVLEPL
jgi:hypothetical protein